MRKKLRSALAGSIVAAAAAVAVLGGSTASAATAHCPKGKSSITFGVEPYDAGAAFVAAYNDLAKIIEQQMSCPVTLEITQTYVAEVEAMRAGQLDIAEFGPLGYVFARSLAKAEPVAVFADSHKRPLTYTAGIWVPSSSSIQTLKDLKGHTLALSDPASTSGWLYPRWGLLQAGLDVKGKGVTVKQSGGHPQSLAALKAGKVDAAEINSQQQATAEAAKEFDPSQFREIWKSKDIPNDPITVAASETPAFKAALRKALFKIPAAKLKKMDEEFGATGAAGPLAPATDAMFKDISDLARKEGIKLSSIG
ncbi:MAG TPA: phosphate/phosphite/phosphonate ABC transporter substrate-binding protein [Solirubrobacteraceae bacterium]|nr:phosphate/phosphite/phosphonate ABC transporter substrate-binding protein [Solirubrobacteraceae bacterium]